MTSINRNEMIDNEWQQPILLYPTSTSQTPPFLQELTKQKRWIYIFKDFFLISRRTESCLPDDYLVMLKSDDVINADESNLTMLRHPFSFPSKNLFVQWHETSNL